MSATPAASLPRFGLLVSDPLRILGFQTLLGDGERCHAVPISETRAADLTDLALLIIDADAAEHLFELTAALARLRPQLRLIVIGSESTSDYMERLIDTGVRGYLVHTSTERELESCIEVVRDGSIWAPRKVLARLIHARGRRPEEEAKPATLTTRERQVLHRLILGRSNREIGVELGLGEGTIKAHLAKMMRKAGVSNRTALTLQAERLGWYSSILGSNS